MTDTTAQRWNQDAQVEHLHSLRLKIAALSETLAQRELTGRTLRLTIEAELRAKGTGKTEAEKLAIAELPYLDHARRSIELAYDKAVAEAHAESLLLGIRLRVADLALGVE